MLTQKAREMVARLGYAERPVDTASDLRYDTDFQEYVEKNDKPHPDWDAVLAARPSVLGFWYRQSPDHMLAEGFRDQLLSPGIVTRNDPPTVLSGMINVVLDPQGTAHLFPGDSTAEGKFEYAVGSGSTGVFCSPRPDLIRRSFRRRSPHGTPG